MALAEGPAAASAPPAIDFDKPSSCGLDAASSAQSRAACREAKNKNRKLEEIERLQRSLTLVGPSDPLRSCKLVGKIDETIAAKSTAGLKGSEVSAMKSAAATLEERLQDVVDRTTTTETAGLRQEVALLHARLEQVSTENAHLQSENGQLKVDMAELRTMVADLIERQRSSAPVPPSPEAEGLNEVEELRRQLLIQEARSSTVERAR
ncbi:hypothetical protein FEC35_18880, partial [Acinetobacter baumannii]